MIVIEDEISSFEKNAILRWRLQPGNWTLDDNVISNGVLSLTIKSSEGISLNLSTGQESRYYYQKTELPVLEVYSKKATKITTIIQEIK